MTTVDNPIDGQIYKLKCHLENIEIPAMWTTLSGWVCFWSHKSGEISTFGNTCNDYLDGELWEEG